MIKYEIPADKQKDYDGKEHQFIGVLSPERLSEIENLLIEEDRKDLKMKTEDIMNHIFGISDYKDRLFAERMIKLGYLAAQASYEMPENKNG